MELAQGVTLPRGLSPWSTRGVSLALERGCVWQGRLGSLPATCGRK